MNASLQSALVAIGALAYPSAAVAQTIALPEVHDVYAYGHVGKATGDFDSTTYGAGVELGFAARSRRWLGYEFLPELALGYGQTDGFRMRRESSAGDFELQGGVRGDVSDLPESGYPSMVLLRRKHAGGDRRFDRVRNIHA